MSAWVALPVVAVIVLSVVPGVDDRRHQPNWRKPRRVGGTSRGGIGAVAV